MARSTVPEIRPNVGVCARASSVLRPRYGEVATLRPHLARLGTRTVGIEETGQPPTEGAPWPGSTASTILIDPVGATMTRTRTCDPHPTPTWRAASPPRSNASPGKGSSARPATSCRPSNGSAGPPTSGTPSGPSSFPSTAPQRLERAAAARQIAAAQRLAGSHTTTTRGFDTSGFRSNVRRDHLGRLVIDWSRADVAPAAVECEAWPSLRTLLAQSL